MVRRNFANRDEADQLCAELNAEYVSKTGTSDLRKTTLDPEQIKFCEAAMLKLEKSGDLLTAVDFWLRHGRPDSIKESPRVDDAFTAFKAWMEKTNSLRHQTKLTRSGELAHFVQFVGEVRVVDLTLDHVSRYLDGLDIKPDSRDAKRKIISSFFNWCMQPERRWCHQNPCLSLKIEGVSKAGEREPQVFSVEDCTKLLRSAETYRNGEMVPTIALCMFAGVRPAECARLDWEQVNFDDSELTITAKQSKTGRKRTIFLDEPLKWDRE
jgi:integrase